MGAVSWTERKLSKKTKRRMNLARKARNAVEAVRDQATV
ncbi:hypothetical protein FP2506_01955 [Fulvimarina pelagi HTCC2506]|uniref:30S ribosomal protein S20 n=1 Tax=Fulvimarina pelagi HTCC2506 TaxID=314231 RepID=Q0FYM9_9HYPH|nr:hypothetical protein FP2506_01955 [Fulvimarina pelagi HTCC2506]